MHDVHDSWHFINASSTWFRNWEGKGRERGGGVSGGYFLSFFSSSLNPWFDLRSHTLYELGNKRNVPQHTSPPVLPERATGGFQKQNFNLSTLTCRYGTTKE